MSKKNYIGLIVLTFLIVVAGTLSYYASNINGTLKGTSLKFAFNVYKIINSNETTFSDINLYDTAKVHNGIGEVIVPGDYGDFVIKVSSKGSEVKLRYDINLKGNDIPVNMKFYLDSEKIDKIDITDLNLNGILDLEEEKEYTIYWEWPYDSGNDNIYDIDYQGKTFSIGLDIKGKQTKNTEYAINYIGFDNSVVFPSVIDKDEELSIDLSKYNYTSLSLKQGNNDLSLDTHYTYENGILKLHNIIDNVTITNLTSFCLRHSEITNLGECLIATDYPHFRKDRSLENARNNIESKKADFTKVEPYLTYTENNSYHITDKNYNTNNTSSVMYYYTTSPITFSSVTGYRTLTDRKSGTIEEIKNNNGYTCFYTWDAATCTTVYKIYAYEEVNNKIVITDYDKYTFSLNEDYSSKAGLYATEDENNTKSYYFRGEVNNNWVSFGGFYWHILRINGDGSIRLIYSGTKDNHKGSGTTIGSSQFNTKQHGATYVGYMYNDDDMVVASYPNTNPTKVSGYATFTNMNPSTKYYFSKNAPECDTTTKTCTLTCNVGTDCMYATWPELYENYDKTDSSSNTNNWKYTSEYKYTCFSYGSLLNNKVTCPIVSEIKGVPAYSKTTNGVTEYIAYNNRAMVQYHGLFSPSYESAVKNVKDSTIKTFIDNWYKTNIYDKNLESYIQNQIFCNDRSISTKLWSVGDGYSLNKTTLYNPYYRMITSHEPTLICQNENDKFTLKVDSLSSIKGTSGYGNNTLNYPVGLMTTDEVVLAGGLYNTMNSKYYLNNSTYTWTLSPSHWFAGNANSIAWIVYSTGDLNNNHPAAWRDVRPVINLISGIQVESGSGTENDPYILLEN